MINIAELLKDAPTGMELYSPLFGEVEFVRIDKQSSYPIDVKDCKGNGKSFTEFGVYFAEHPDAECLLFPSKDCRTWEGWKLPSEPNLKVGDWVVKKDGNTFYGGNYAEQITLIEVDEKGKRIWLSSTTYVHDNDIHLWTIADARDGDVLATDNGWTCIFQAFDGCGFGSYCFMDSQKWFCELGSEVHTLDSRINGNIHPANKEQCNQFFTKMKEVGYIWDAEKKELRKIIEPKFRVGNTIKWIDHDVQEQRIIGIKKDSYITVDQYGIRCALKFVKQDEWELVPKPHYDILNFKPFDKILGRNCCRSGVWRADYFSHIHKNGKLFVGIGYTWEQCIPFNEKTKHLLGTTKPCGEEYINW